MKFEVMHGEEGGYGIYCTGNEVAACIMFLRERAKNGDDIKMGPFVVTNLDTQQQRMVSMTTVISVLVLANNEGI